MLGPPFGAEAADTHARDGSPPAPSVRRLDDGRFEVRYTPMVSLPLLLQLAVRRGAGPDEPIGASPFAVDVAPGEVCAERCDVRGDGLIGAELRRPATFVVVARDAYGNQLRGGGDRVHLSFRGRCNPTAHVHDRGDGSYGVAWASGITGDCVLSLTIGGAPVRGSPFAIAVGPNRLVVNSW